MALNLTLWQFFLAQAESSDVTDFFGQVSGLVGLTCTAGLIWIVLTAFVLRRSAERRRRAAEGLAPLPSMYTSAWRALRGERAEARPVEVRAVSAARDRTPAPDLALLTGDLPVSPVIAEPVQAPPEDTPDETSPPFETEHTTMPEHSAEADELLRVWRDRSTGALSVALDGRRVSAADALSDADLRDRLSAIVSDLSELLALPDAASLIAPDPAPSERPVRRQIRRAALGQTRVEPDETGPRSIADQIEDLLQSRLEREPAFQGRAIHVRPSGQGGVSIVVDDRRYDGIGEIDDPEVRALLEDVVRGWETTQ